jgi:hypothetical protein
MIEQGIYDEEPAYIRATIYERLFQKVPLIGYEHHDGSVQHEKLEEWIENNKFVLHHRKLINNVKDGETQDIQFFLHKEQEAVLITKRKLAHTNFAPGVMSISNIADVAEYRNKNPHKFEWISLYCDSLDVSKNFKEFLQTIKIVEDHKNRLFMLKSTPYDGLQLDSFPIRCEDMDLVLNYGSKFLNIHDKVITNLNEKKSGLYIFHGLPGTGKTFYVKYLTTVVDKKKFIFVPNALVADLFSPKMVDSLYSLKDSVLVLEDAEICIFKRDGQNNELVSGILNITDGLLKDILNISVVITFNAANISEIDKALLRKGRLMVMYEFGLLPKHEAQVLATHLGKTNKVSKNCSLADVYNLDEDTGVDENQPEVFGFVAGKR